MIQHITKCVANVIIRVQKCPNEGEDSEIA